MSEIEDGRSSAGLRKVRAVVAYDGTDFCGFQRQENAPSVGDALETALGELFKRATPVVAAGRTDTGVHASGQVVSFWAPAGFPLEKLPVAANSVLPRSVTLHRPAEVDGGFSARFDAVARRYVYRVLNRRERCALRARYTGHDYHALDLDAIRRAAEALVGEHDFRAFCGMLPERGGTMRTVHHVTVERQGEIVRFEILGAGFLHRMVRITVGTLLEIGAGRRPVDDIPRILASRDRRQAGLTAEASGLFLAGALYAGFDSTTEPPG